MNHIYPAAKGDQLCPLGFHPQVRWPTRCKRCFRDYKEHGNRRTGDDVTASTPALSGSTHSRLRDSSGSLDTPVRSWTSTHNLFVSNSSDSNNNGSRIGLPQRPASWASTPDLDNVLKKADVTVNLALPRRRPQTMFEKDEPITVTVKRPPIPPTASKVEIKKPDENIEIQKGDSLAERVRKLNMMRRQSSLEKEGSVEKTAPDKTEKKPDPPTSTLPAPAPEKRVRKRVVSPAPPPIEETPKDEIKKVILKKVEPKKEPPIKEREPDPTTTTTVKVVRRRVRTEPVEPSDPQISKPKSPPPKVVEVHPPQPQPQPISDESRFLIHIKDKSSKKSDDMLSTTTETTEATLIDRNDKELLDEIESLKRELETVKSRCERAERDKSDILLRRLASMDTVPNKTAASEALKLQQKVNELNQVVEDLQDEKKFLSTKMKELEQDSSAKGVKNMEEQLRSKLEQAEGLCEELMDENEEIKRELRNMETEIEEMHDNFREEQADEYASLKKELDQTTKNCRILSFKLKKSDRKIEQLESDKKALGVTTDLAQKVKQLEDELSVANEVARRLQNELEKAEPTKKKAPSIGKIGKSTSADGKIKRESLTRGGSQEDPVQLLRDLQDSLEREADLREQLKFAEEEAESLRRKSSRVEDENDSLVMQLKKMATKAKSRKLSPSPIRSHHIPVEKDEGISDEEDPAELRLQLELIEQETSVLRRKVEELELENKSSKQELKDVQDNLAAKTKEVELIAKKSSGIRSSGIKDPLEANKIKVMEDEINELRTKLIEKDREFERVQAEISLGKGKKSSTKSKSQDSTLTEQQSLDLKRQLQVVEQEANVLRSKTQTLEQENDKYLAEIKQMQLQAEKAKTTAATTATNAEIKKLKENLETFEKEKKELEAKLNRVLEDSAKSLPPRTPKVYSDMNTKLQLRKMIEECENEILEYRALIAKSGANDINKMEEEKSKLEKELIESKYQYTKAEDEIKTLKATKDAAALQSSKLTEAQHKVQKLEYENKEHSDKIKNLEDKITKINGTMKITESCKNLLETQLKQAKDKHISAEKELEKEKKDRLKWEHKITELETEILSAKRNADRTRENLENEIDSLKNKSSTAELPSKKLQELKAKNEELEVELEDQIQKYNNLTSKFEALQEEAVLSKAQASIDAEKIHNGVESMKNKLSDGLITEVRMKKENTELSKKLIESQRKCIALESTSGNRYTSAELEKNRIRSQLDDKIREYENLEKENEMNAYQVTQLKKDNDDLKGKLDDYERINKAQRTLNEHNSALENELKKLKMKLDNAEMNVKSEVAATRLRYEQQVTNLQNELTAMQRQCERFKRDRDTFKQLVEAAQKQIGDMKANRRSIVSSTSSDDDDKSKIVALEQQVGCLEDELSEARLEASKVRTELVSELSASEIKISEMQSKLNEFEEDKILGGGKTRIPGTATRLELSWQKEREEMTRLLQETSTLARDLRQTLFEVERERDKERLESRRKIDQIKKTTEEEIEEGRRKVSELQKDLLDLRDVHAKLRTANEKLRRDRDRFEREREYIIKRKMEHDGERRVGALLQTVDELVKRAPDLQIISKPKDASDKTPTTLNAPIPTPPARNKSRSPSPGPSAGAPQMPISTVLARLAEASEELRKYQRMCDDDRERERMRRGGMRRAASTENDNLMEPSTGRPILRMRPQNGGSLYRKSLSLDQSMQAEQAGLIWKQDDDSMSSLQSIDSEYGSMMMRRDGSLDSRLSGGSTQSDMPRTRKKKRGLMGKLRSLASRGTESDVSHQGSHSDLSLAGDIRSSKKDLRNRLSGMFRRSTSRTNSTESIDSALRPVAIQTMGNGPTPMGTPASTSHLQRSGAKPPTPSSVPSQRRRVVTNIQSQNQNQ